MCLSNVRAWNWNAIKGGLLFSLDSFQFFASLSFVRNWRSLIDTKVCADSLRLFMSDCCMIVAYWCLFNNHMILISSLSLIFFCVLECTAKSHWIFVSVIFIFSFLLSSAKSRSRRKSRFCNQSGRCLSANVWNVRCRSLNGNNINVIIASFFLFLFF